MLAVGQRQCRARFEGVAALPELCGRSNKYPVPPAALWIRRHWAGITAVSVQGLLQGWRSLGCTVQHLYFPRASYIPSEVAAA